MHHHVNPGGTLSWLEFDCNQLGLIQFPGLGLPIFLAELALEQDLTGVGPSSLEVRDDMHWPNVTSASVAARSTPELFGVRVSSPINLTLTPCRKYTIRIRFMRVINSSDFW